MSLLYGVNYSYSLDHDSLFSVRVPCELEGMFRSFREGVVARYIHLLNLITVPVQMRHVIAGGNVALFIIWF